MRYHNNLLESVSNGVIQKSSLSYSFTIVMNVKIMLPENVRFIILFATVIPSVILPPSCNVAFKAKAYKMIASCKVPA